MGDQGRRQRGGEPVGGGVAVEGSSDFALGGELRPGAGAAALVGSVTAMWSRWQIER